MSGGAGTEETFVLPTVPAHGEERNLACWRWKLDYVLLDNGICKGASGLRVSHVSLAVCGVREDPERERQSFSFCILRFGADRVDKYSSASSGTFSYFKSLGISDLILWGVYFGIVLWDKTG